MQIEEFNHIVASIKDKMFRLAYRIVRDQEEARDVVQDALIKVWDKREILSNVDNKEAYTMTITRNMAIDLIRSRKMETTDVENHYDLEVKTPDPERQTIVKDEYTAIRNMIDSLSENHRTVVHLRDVEGYSYKEISEMTGYSIEKVKVYLHRARTKLKEQIKNKFSEYKYR